MSDASSGVEYPVSVIAKLFDLTERRVQQLAADGIIPKGSRGKYPLVGAVQGYIRFLRESSKSEETDYELSRARIARAKAEMAEIELERMRGTVALVADFASIVAPEYAEVREKMRSLGHTVAKYIVGQPDANVIADEIDDRVEKILLALKADRSPVAIAPPDEPEIPLLDE